MKKFSVKITALLLSVLLTSSTIYALSNANAEIGVNGDEELNEEVIENEKLRTEEELTLNSEVIVEENIDTVCDSIKILSADTVKADDGLKVLGQTDYSDNNAVCEVGIQTYVVLDNLALPLLPTFYDPNMALELIQDRCGIVINELKTTYGLEDLSNENWQEYRKCLYDRFDDENKPDWYEETNDQIDDFIYFFEIYALLSQNNYLVSLAASASSVHELLSNEDFLLNLSYYVLDDLVEENIIEHTNEIGGEYRVVPDNSELSSSEIETTTPNNSVALYSFSKANAKQYAIDYAKTPNPNFGYIDGADCTNFASQIMLAGGKSYTPTWITACVLGKWTYANAWSNANEFVNYWTLHAKYSTHKDFSDNLKKGDFITYDKNNNGVWDHMGFVVNVKSEVTPSLGYRNYRVAQHTGNYLLWAGNSKCKWDTLKSKYPNCSYGIVRVS